MITYKEKKRAIRGFFIVRAPFVAPFFAAVFYIILCCFIPNLVKPNKIDVISNLSGVFAGFLLTSAGIMSALPNNKFVEGLKKSGYFKRVTFTMFLGTVLLLISILLSIFYDSIPNLIGFVFILGFSEVLLSSYYLFKITELASESI